LLAKYNEVSKDNGAMGIADDGLYKFLIS